MGLGSYFFVLLVYISFIETESTRLCGHLCIIAIYLLGLIILESLVRKREISHVVPVSGLVITKLLTAQNENTTVIELWGDREKKEKQRRQLMEDERIQVWLRL